MENQKNIYTMTKNDFNDLKDVDKNTLEFNVDFIIIKPLEKNEPNNEDPFSSGFAFFDVYAPINNEIKRIAKYSDVIDFKIPVSMDVLSESKLTRVFPKNMQFKLNVKDYGSTIIIDAFLINPIKSI